MIVLWGGGVGGGACGKELYYLLSISTTDSQECEERQKELVQKDVA